MAKRKTAKKARKARATASVNYKKRNMIIGSVIVVLIVLAVLATYKSNDRGAQKITMQTSKGQIVMEVYPKLMPVTVKNFQRLVDSNFYNGLTFHRVEDWVIQGGDPKGNGTGGPGWTIPLETNPELKNVRGAVAMARSSDPNSAGSQFYILKKDQPALDGDYAVFGKVISGMDVVDKIQVGDKIISVKE